METGNQPGTPTTAANAVQPAPASGIPISERFPRLTSSQYRFTTASAIKNLDPEQRNVYRVVVKLSARPNTTFTNNNSSGIPWTFAVKDFIRMLNAHDDKAMILPRRENAKINKIASHDDVPESTDDFERDYAWNARLQGSNVTFTVMLSTTHPFMRTFKRGKIFEKLQNNNWYINLDRLETQETTAKVGVLLFAHSRWANQEEILEEIKKLIAPTVCTDIDVRVDRPYKTYYDREEIVIENGSQKKKSIRTRWPAIYAPIDIAAELKNTLVNNWPSLQTDPVYNEFNCKQYIFIPDTPLPRNSRNSHQTFTAAQKQSYSNYLHYMRKQNVFLNTYSQVLVLQNVGNIHANFTWTEELAEHIVGSRSSVGVTQTLRHFLTTITRAANPNERTIHSIHREVEKGTWTLLVDKDDAQELRVTINKLVPFLQATPAFSGIRVGGTNGAFTTERNDHSAIGYLAVLGTSNDYICEPTVLDSGGDATMTTVPVRQIDYNAPPTTYRREKNTVPARFVRPSATSAVMNYSDVLATTPLRHNPYLQAAQVNTTATIATQESAATSLTSQEPSLNVDTLFQNQKFKNMMAELIEPHIAPARQEVLQMKTTMANLQEKTSRIENSVASIATLNSKFDHLMGMMATMSQQIITNNSTTSETHSVPPHKKHCSDTVHDGASIPHENYFSGHLHHNNTDDEAEAGQQR